MRIPATKQIPRVIGALFLYSGLHKLFYPGEATLGLETLGASSGLAAAAVVTVVIAELYLGVLLLTGVDLRYAMALSTAMMLVFTGYLFYLSTLAHPPSCGYLGLSGIFTSSRQAAFFGLARNCLILWGLKLAYDSRFRKKEPPRRAAVASVSI
jgi:uncharacterized membrane protein YphA (DoxX/SURF4 family)